MRHLHVVDRVSLYMYWVVLSGGAASGLDLYEFPSLCCDQTVKYLDDSRDLEKVLSPAEQSQPLEMAPFN